MFADFSTILTSLILLGVLGTFVYWLRYKLFVTVTVIVGPKLYRYRTLLKWLGKTVDLKNYEYTQTWRNDNPKLDEKSSKSIRGDPSEVDSSDDDEPRQQPSSSRLRMKYSKVPAVGTHYFNYQNCLIRLQRTLLDSTTDTSSLTFTTLSKNAKVLESILESAKPKDILAVNKYRKNEVAIHYPNSLLNGWIPLDLQSTKRSLETLALAKNLGEDLLADVEKFLTKEEWYFKRGIPYRRVYLLHGPPGCGKSSLVKAIAGKIEYDISVLPLTERLSDENIMRLINKAPKRSVILLEEVDAAFPKGLEGDAVQDPSDNFAYSSRTGNTLSVSGFCNALDGVGAPEDGLIIFMTSHHPERLDRSLIRPGRVDYHVLLDYPNKSQLEKMFDKFVPDADENHKQRFLRIIKDCQDMDIKVSAAMIQGLFVKYSESIEQVLDGAEEFIRHKFSDKNNNSSSHIYM